MRPAVVPAFGLALTLAAVIAAALLYQRLPDATPIHFSIDGPADGFVHKPLGPFAYALMLGVLTLVMSLAPAISPNRFRMEPFAPSYRLIVCALLALIGWIDACVTAAGLGAPLDPSRAGLLGLGLMLMVVGNVMGKVTPNFFVGVRTPWTLASPEVWRRTHRTAGWALVALGAVVALAELFDAPPAAPFLALAAVAVGLIVYSYVIYRRLGAEPDQ
jgi:uncharacterized membrane protein